MSSRSVFYSTVGTHNFVVPADVSLLRYTAIASGGGAGSGSDNRNGGASAGSGEYCVRKRMHVTPGDTVVVVIGAAGLGSNVDTAQGTDGDPCTIGAFSLQGGGGGSGGQLDNLDNHAKGGGYGGYIPGTPTGRAPQTPSPWNNAGLDGGTGFRESRSCWGGSGAGGWVTNSTVTAPRGGNGADYAGAAGGTRQLVGGFFMAGGAGGASSYFGAGGVGADGGQVGNVGVGFGTGGGGGGGSDNNPTHTGGDGFRGCVLIEYSA